VPVLCLRDMEGKVRTVVFGYACHATVLSFYQWCGDYPGFAQLELEKRYPDATALFFAGCGADQNPLPRRTVDLAEGYGKQLAGAVEAVLKAPMASVRPTMKNAYATVDVPFGELPTREKLVQDTASKNQYIAARAKKLLKDLEKNGTLKQNYPYPVQAWQLGGDLTWVALSGEVVVDYSLRFKKELGKVWVAGYSNDVLAYIPSLRVLKEGGYEGDTSMIYYGHPCAWGPRIEELIVRTVHEQVAKVRK
jgi:neutral ceramidase